MPDLQVPGGYVISEEAIEESYRRAILEGHASCYFQLAGGEDSAFYFVRIIDLYDPDRPTITVTNDAEHVVRVSMFYAQKILQDGKVFPAVIYQDTLGNWDEMRHNKGHFYSFRALNTRDAQRAGEVVRALHERDLLRTIN